MHRFILFVFVFSTCVSSYSQESSTVKRHHSPHASFDMIDVDNVNWMDGFWAVKLNVCHETMVPHIWRLFNNPEFSHAYDNFKIAAGLKEGRHRGAKFSDGEIYKWMEAAAYTYAVTKDESLNRLLDEIIKVIAKAQREDGYIHTPVIIAQRNGTSQQEWNDQLHFETYNMGHLMTTACAHYKATGKATLLNVAVQAAEYLKRVCDEKPKELAGVTICPSHYMGIIDIYRATHDSTFLDLAQRLIDIRSLTENGTDQNQDRIPFREQTEAVGHTVRANYLYAGITDVFLENGDQTLLPALRSIWEDVVFRKMYITGSTGALYDGASPDGSKDHSGIQLVHQAYGRPYQLPNVTAYNETCATIGNALWNWRMLRMSGDSRFADVLELALYNGILSGISLEGKDYFYTNPLRVDSELPFPLRWSRERQPYFGSFCCPPNIVRIIAGISQYAYGISDNAVWVNLYGANRLETAFTNGQPIALKQSTNYPWDGTIQIEIESAETNNFEIKLRIPKWANGASISMNEKPITEAIIPGTYCSIQRTWKQNDVIEINFPMRVMLMEAHPLVEELRNQIAIKRGPIVYCLESNEIPNEAKISDIVVPNDIDFTSRYEADFLCGVTVLEGTVFLQSQTDWKQALYQEHLSLKRTKINARFIPYFSWGNRGKSEMSVWLPFQ